MMAIPSDTRVWTRRRWVLAVVSIMAVEVGLVFGFGDRRPRSGEIPGGNIGPVRFFPAAMSQSEVLKLFPTADPLLFVVAGDRGFSRSAWLGSRRGVEEASAPDEPPQFLRLDIASLGSGFKQIADQRPETSVNLAEKSFPEPAPFEPALPQPETASILRVEGELEERMAAGSLRLPAWGHSELLTNSIVGVTIDRRGELVAARLLKRSGLAEADRYALRAAWSLQFKPAKEATAGLASGRLIFQWRTRAPVATNAPSGNF